MQLRCEITGRETPQPASPDSALARVRALPRALAIAFLLCLLAQGIAVQSHVHFFGQANRAAAASAGVHATSAPSASAPAADCPLCQEAAMAGAYLLPAAIVVPAAPAPLLWIASGANREFHLLGPAKGWQGRAPPQ